MTPQLQQAIKLLQMNNMELKEFVEQELAENPMLERDESDGRLPEEVPPETETDADGETNAADSDAPDALQSMDISQLENVKKLLKE